MAAGVSSNSRKIIEDTESITCPICLEIYEKPCRIQCGHVFCTQCLVSSFHDVQEACCPICRETFHLSQRQRANTIEKLISGSKGICKGCSKKMSLHKLRSHNATCQKLKIPVTFKPVAETSQPIPSDVPNRSTFRCPYCNLANLDNQGLLKHCNDKHRNSGTAVICPICVSMPWGDPTQKSSNFITHLNLRHRFDYDTYVDYQQDDEAMLQAAIECSLKEL